MTHSQWSKSAREKWQALRTRSRRRNRHRNRPLREWAVRLGMEQLEDRRLLAVIISDNKYTSGADYILSDSESITISDNVVIDTSIPGGAAGAITLTAPIINIGNSVQLIANGATPGSITLNANHTWADPTLAFWDFLESVYTGTTNGLTASIGIGNSAQILGGDFSAIVTAGDSEVLSKSEATTFAGQFESQVFNYLNDLIDLPISVVYKTPSATMTLGSGARIASSGKVSLITSSVANAQGEAIFNMIADKVTKGLGGYGGFAFGVSYTDVQATTTVSQNSAISAAGDVIVSASAINTTAIKARVTQNVGMQPTNPGNVQLSFGWSELNSAATTLVDTGAVITAGGNVHVTATGKDVDQVSVSTTSYRDGKVGVAIGVGRTTANIQATVNGTIHSGNAPVAASKTFNPALSVNFDDSSLNFATAPGYTNGDMVLYSSGLGGPIPGLISGETYYAIVDPSAPKAIKLAASLADAVAKRNIVFRPAYPTLTNGSLSVPLTHVQVQGSGPDDSNLILFDFATQSGGNAPLFTEGQTVTYTKSDGNYLGYNDSDGTLLGPLPNDSYTVHIVHNTADEQGPYAIQLCDSNGAVIRLNDNPVFTTATGQRLEVFAFDPDGGTVNFNFPNNPLSARNVTLTNGQPLTYTEALATNVTGLNGGQTYYAVVDPATPGVIRLASTLPQAQAANPAIQRALPTLTISSQTLNIDSVEPDIGLIFSLNPNIQDGTAVVYHAVPGKPIGGLTDGSTYYAYNQTLPYFDPDSPAYALALREHHLYGQDISLSLAQALTDGSGNAYMLQGTDSLRNVLSIASSNPLSISAAHDAQLVGGRSTLQSLPANSQQLWTNAAGGTFTISAVINSQTLTTVPLACNATASQVQTALNQLGGLTTTVTGLGTYADPWLVSAADMPSLTTDDAQLQQGNSWVRTASDGAQRLSNSATGGTFTLSVSVNSKTLTTAALPYNATAAQVETALEALAGVQATVTGAGTAADPWLIHGGVFLIQSGDPLVFSDSFGAGNSGLLNGQTYYAAVAPSQPYPDRLLLALAATRDEALQASPTAVDLRQCVDLGKVDLSYMSGTAHLIVPATVSGGILVQASLTSKDAMSTGASTGGEPGLINLLNQGDIASNYANGTTGWERAARELLGKTDNAQNKSLGDLIQEKAAGQQANNTLSLAASIGYLEVNNSVEAIIGGTASLLSDGDISVESVLKESVQPQVTSGVSKPKVEGGTTGTSFATSVMIGQFNNLSHSIVESQASLTAAHHVKVDSDIVYPWAWQIANPGGFSAESFFADNTLANLSTLLDGNLGIDNWLVNSWSQALAPSPQSKLTFTLSVSWLNFTNDGLAQVCDGAQINQDAGVAFAADQGVSITADTDMMQVGFTGIVGLGFSAEQISKVIRKGGASGFLNTMQGGTVALGGSIGYVSVNNTTQALLGGSPPASDPGKAGAPGITRVSFGNGGLSVDADEHLTYVQVAQGGSDGQQYGISGTLTLPEVNTTTKARIFAGAAIQSLDGTQGKLEVNAVDDLDLITTSGGVLIGGNVQVGVSTGVDKITRNVLALIGDDPDSAAAGTSAFNVSGPVKVEADATGVIVAAAVAASKLSAAPPPGQEQQIANEEVQEAGDAPNASFGWAVSGDFTWVSLTDTVLACVNDLGVFTGTRSDFNVAATDSTKIISAGGAAAFSTVQNSRSVGLAGSGAVIDVTGSVEASISGASLNHFALSVSAADERTLINLAAGGSGATVGNSNIAIAGSAAVTTLHGTTTQASLDGVNAILSGDSKVEADDNATLVTIAGAFVKGGKSGFGLGSTVNHEDRTTQVSITNSQVTQNSGGLSVAATDSLKSVSIAAGVAFTNSGVALSGMFADNVSSSTTTAALTGGSYSNQDPTAAGSLSVSAQDTPVLVTLEGDASANKTGNTGIGAAVTYASVSSTNSAELNNATVTLTAGGLSLTSTSGDPPDGLSDSDLDQLDLPGRSNHAIYSFSIGGAGSNNVSLAGSVTVNNIHGSNLAAIAQNSSVTAGGSIVVQATNGSTIGAASGAITASPDGKVAFGAAVVNSTINTNAADKTAALIDASQVTSTAGSIELSALSNFQIGTAAAGGNGAEVFAGGGSVVNNAIGSATSATISDASSVSAATDLTVEADNNSKIGTGAGQVDVATKGNAAGASVAINKVNNSVLSTITASTATGGNSLSVAADSKETIDAYAMGVGGSVAASTYDFPVQVGLVGSGSGNNIFSSTQALIQSRSTVSTGSGGSMEVTAFDDSSITAVAGTLSVQPVAEDVISVAVGASAATNNLGNSSNVNSVKADIDNSTVIAGSFELSAESDPSIVAATAAGAGDFSPDDNTLVGICGAGAGSGNTIFTIVEATVGNGSSVTTNGSGNLSIEADTKGDIRSGAGGVATAGQRYNAEGTGVAVTVGAAVAINTCNSTTRAQVLGSTVNSAGDLSISAKNTVSLESYTVGVAGSLSSSGSNGIAVGGAGSGSGNTITGKTEALIGDLKIGGANTRSSVISGGKVSLTATDSSQITAGAGAAAIAIVGGSKRLGVAVAVGASVSINSITSKVTANIDNSSVQAAGDIQLSATTQRPDPHSYNIEAITVAGGVAVGISQGNSVAFAGAGAGSGNTITNSVTASITDCIGSDSQNNVISVSSLKGGIALTAQDGAAILADGGGATVSFDASTGAPAAGVAVGMGIASNSITNTTKATIDNSQVSAQGNVALTSTSTAISDAKAFGVALDLSVSTAGGISAAGSGAGAHNTLKNTVEASLKNGSVISSYSTAKNAIALNATDNSQTTASGGAGSLSVDVSPKGVGLAVGAVVSNNTIQNTISSLIDDATATSAGGVSLAATNSPSATAVAVAVAATITASAEGGAFTGSGASSTNTAANSVTAAIRNDSHVAANGTSNGTGVSISASDAVTIDASVGTGALAIGLIGASIGVSLTDNAVNDTVAAKISDSTVSSSGQEVRVAASSNNTVTGMAVATAATISPYGVSGAGGHSNSSDTSNITASVDADATIETDGWTQDEVRTFGALNVSASGGGQVKSEIDGGTLGLGSIGVFFANSTRGGTTLAFVDGGAALTIGNLSVSANSAYQLEAKGWTLTIGILTGDGTSATAIAKDSVQAYFGSSLTASVPSPLPTANLNGSLSVNAAANHTSSATADGGVGSLGYPFSLGIGVYTADSTVQPTVQSYVRGISVSIPGSLAVTSRANNSTAANATAGSGGLAAGDAAIANTTDNTSVTASLCGGTFHAASVTVAGSNNSSYAPHADSVNAAVLGASGAVANHQANTSTTTSLADNTSIYSSGPVSLTSAEQFLESTQGNTTVAAAGGALNITAAVSSATLTGSSSLSVGNSVVINAGSILMFASTALTHDDRVSLTTGGAIEGAGVNSAIDATLNNSVSIGASGTFTSKSNIGVGTQTTVNAQTNSAVTTYGIAGVGIADASTKVTSNQQVTVGTNTAMSAAGDLNLTAGAEPVGLGVTMLSGSTYAQGYVRDLIAIPHANASTTLISNAALNVAVGTQLSSGQDIIAGTYPGTPGTFADGTGHGYELGFIPATSHGSHTSTSTTSNTALSGTLTAGIYHELTITIPNDQSENNGFSSTLIINPNGPAYTYFSHSFQSPFYAPSYISQHFSGITASTLESGVSTQGVGAFFLDQLFATGGTVTVNADTLSGNGSITAYGAPTISITNNSPDYLILGSITIPNQPGGEVNFTGNAGSAPAGMTVNRIGEDEEASLIVNQAYSSNVGGVPYGPALFLMGDIQVLGGDVTITNATGSLGQAAMICAKQINVTAPEGAVVVDNPGGTEFVGGDPYSEWEPLMIWPGGDPGSQRPNADLAVSYVANSAFPLSNPDPQNPMDLLDFQFLLYGVANSTPTQSTVFFGNSVPYVQNMGDDSQATNEQWSTRSGSVAAAYPLGSNGPSNNQGWLPMVPIVPLSATIASYPAASSSTGISASKVAIRAKTIDLNGDIKAGQLKNWSVNFPAALSDTLATYREGYQQGLNPAIYVIPLDQAAPVSQGDNQITASYNAQTNQIVLDNVSVSGESEVILIGAIVNTHPQGKIEVLGGMGQVTVNNQTNIPLVVQDIVADEKASISRIDITDTNLPDDSNRTLYLSEPGQPIAVFKGQAGDASLGTGTPDSTVSGTTTTYAPQSGLRWQWIEKASLYRTITDSNSWQITDWSWNFPAGSPNDPWLYVDPNTNQSTGTPVGKTIIQAGGPVFQQVVTGTIDSQSLVTVTYHDGHYGFANNNGQSQWDYYYPVNATLTLTSSVKADNPITLDFSGIAANNAISITSLNDILLAGNIQAADSLPSTVQTTSGSVTASTDASLASGSLNLQASGSIGTTGSPLPLTLNNNGVLNANAGIGGIYLTVDSTATLGQLQSGTGNSRGNVVLEVTESIVALSGTAVPSNVFGNNITLISDHGGIGSEESPVLIACQGRLRVKAPTDIWVEQSQGDLGVDQILSTGGNVNVAVPQGSLFDATAWMIDSVPSDVQQQVYQSLGLTDPSASQVTVTSFENLAERNYQLYWQLMQHGTVQNGTYTLSPSGLAYYKSSLAGQGLGDLSNTQVQASASNFYGSVTGFLGANVSANWQSMPEFQTYTPNYQYAATASQINSLTQNAVWNVNQLTYMVQDSGMQSSLLDSSGSDASPPNIQGIQVNLSAGNGIGEQDTPVFLPLAGLQAGTYTPSQDEALALARGNQPGDVMLVGNHAGYGEVFLLQDLDTNTDTITAIQLSLSRPLRVATAYPLNASAQGAINVQQTDSSLQVSGFGGSGSDWTTNSSTAGMPTISNDVLTLADNKTDEATSAWLQLPVSTSDFQASFTYYGYGMADGMAFVLHNDPRGLNALGANGGSLGYGGPTGTAITPSAAFEINLYAGGGSLIPGTTFVTNGAQGNYNSTGSVVLSIGSPIHIVLTYDSTAQTFTESLTDTRNGATFTRVHSGVDLAATLGETAFLGFTGGTGGLTSTQTISNFQFSQSNIHHLVVGQIHSADGVVTLQADGNIVAVPASSAGAASLISAAGLVVNSGGNAGTASAPLTVNLSGQANISASTGINVQQINGNLHVGYAECDATENVTFTAPSTVFMDHPGVTGFGGNGYDWNVNNSPISTVAGISQDVLTLTNGTSNTASSAWFDAPMPTDSFQIGFRYTGSGSADGAAFVLHNDPRGLAAIGDVGGSLGYGSSSGNPITPSAAWQINLYYPHDGMSSRVPGTNLAFNGSTGSYHSTNPVLVSSGHAIDVVLVYDAAAHTLTELLTDTQTNATYFNTYTGIDLNALLGPTAYIGFTGADGGLTSTQTIQNFQFSSGHTSALAANGGLGLPANPWHNTLSAEDVDGDSQIAPRDALAVINHLNRHLNVMVLPLDSAEPFMDVNADGHVTPMDVLVVINRLNRHSRASAEGEGLAGNGESTVSVQLQTALNRAIFPQITFRHGSGQLPTQRFASVGAHGQSISAEADGYSSSPDWILDRLFGAAPSVAENSHYDDGVTDPDQIDDQVSDLEEVLSAIANDVNQRWQ